MATTATESAQSTASTGSWRNRNIIALGLVSFFTDVSTELLYPLVPLFLTTTLGVTPAVVGVIEGLAEGTASVLKRWSGAFSDRLGKRKPLVIAGYSLSALAKPLLTIAVSWWIVLLARLIDRFGKGVRTSARDALIADSCPPEQRGKAYGFHRGMDTLGACVGPLLAIPLLTAFHGNYRAVFWIACVPAAIGALLTALPQETAKHPDLAPLTLPVQCELPSSFKGFVAIAVVFGLANSSDAFLILRAREIFTAHHAWSPLHTTQVTVLCYALYNFVYAMLSLPAGALSDRTGQRALISGGFATYALVYAGWARAGSDWNVWLLFVVYGIFRALTQGVGTAYAANLAGAKNRGTALGIYHGYVGLAAVAASAAAGLIWTQFGAATMFSFDAALAMLAAGLMLVARPQSSPPIPLYPDGGEGPG